jgi:hypothetical protein
VSEPLGEELLVGIGPEYDHRVADIIPFRSEQNDSRCPWLDADPAGLKGIELGRYLAYRNPPPKEDGSTGVRVLSSDLIEQANTIEVDGTDLVLGRPTRLGLGFQLTMPEVRPLGPNPRAFGHYGAGALLGFADPDERLGCGYVCNQSGRS